MIIRRGGQSQLLRSYFRLHHSAAMTKYPNRMISF